MTRQKPSIPGRKKQTQPSEPCSSLDLSGTFLRESEGWLTTARPRLLRLARARGVPPEAIEDVVQETLLEAWKHLDRLHTPAGVQFWRDAICRTVYRRDARRRTLDLQRFALLPAVPQDDVHEEKEAASFWLQDVPDTQAFDPVEALDDQERAILLDRALGSLSESAREAVELSYLEELPQREVLFSDLFIPSPPQKGPGSHAGTGNIPS